MEIRNNRSGQIWIGFRQIPFSASSNVGGGCPPHRECDESGANSHPVRLCMVPAFFPFHFMRRSLASSKHQLLRLGGEDRGPDGSTEEGGGPQSWPWVGWLVF